MPLSIMGKARGRNRRVKANSSPASPLWSNRTFFADNILDGGQGEWSSGSIAALRIYNGVLGANEIAELNKIPFVNNAVPEPATWAMLISGFGLVGGMMRRRRRAALALA